MINYLVRSLVCGSLLLASAAAIADNEPLTTQIVDLANQVDGVHPGFRAFHAKGVVVEGTFKASPQAARLSRAALFNGSSIRVTARNPLSYQLRRCSPVRRTRRP